jgi:hypothetical protein
VTDPTYNGWCSGAGSGEVEPNFAEVGSALAPSQCGNRYGMSKENVGLLWICSSNDVSKELIGSTVYRANGHPTPPMRKDTASMDDGTRIRSTIVLPFSTKSDCRTTPLCITCTRTAHPA